MSFSLLLYYIQSLPIGTTFTYSEACTGAFGRPRNNLGLATALMKNSYNHLGYIIISSTGKNDAILYKRVL